MRTSITLALFFLVTGPGLIFYFCHGNTGFGFNWPISGSSFHMDVTTTGWPAVAGLAFTAVGLFFLFVSVVLAFLAPPQAVPAQYEPAETRRTGPFES